MRVSGYLPLSAVVFLAATAGAGVFASMSIAGQPFSAALHENLHWMRVELVGTLLLLAPFVVVGLVCAVAEKGAKTRSVLLIYVAAMLALLFFYFLGYQAAERAALRHMWTAATISIAALPFVVGIPVVVLVVVAGALATKFDRRMSD